MKLTLKYVFLVPNLRRNVLSVKKIEMSDYEAVFKLGRVSTWYKWTN